MIEEWLLTPVSEDAPCGPDLEAAGDDAFVDYYYDAESRLPERYFAPGQAADGSADRLFDPRSVTLPRETAAIHELLRRSRDVRLLVLLARFQILAGRAGDFAATLQAMLTALRQWPDGMHPKGERRSAVEALNEQPTVVMPLQHLPLVPNSGVTLRRWLVATGRLPARASEEDLEGTDVLAPLRADAQARPAAQMQEALSRAAAALAGLERHSTDAGATPPDLGAVRQVVADMQALIAEARPDLRPWSPGREAAPAAPAAQPQPRAATMPLPAPSTAIAVPDREAARAALTAAETWLMSHEPSSPVLLLVTQARLLIGLSLVEAIETLMPAQAGQVVLAIGQGSPFALPMARMKELTATARDTRRPVKRADPAPPEIRDRAALDSVLASVAAYYAQNEPASPVPLLISRARELSGRDFSTLMSDLLAAPKQGGEQ